MINKNENLNIQIQHRLVEELTKTNRELKLINNFATTIQVCRKTEEIVSALTNQFNSHFTHQVCNVFLTENYSDYLVQTNYTGDKIVPKFSEAQLIHFREGLIGRVVKTGIAEIVNVTDNEISPSKRSSSIYSEIAIPMLHHKNVVIGVIYSKIPENNFFETKHIETWSIIAAMAANKIMQTKNLEKIANYQSQLEEYVHIVSHDLKSPLRSINALMYWIKEDNAGQLNEPTLKNLALIDTTLLQMENLITGTLNYSKIGHENMGEEMVDLNKVIREIVKTLYLPKHIKLNVVKNLPILKGNEIKFIQIFQNLIENAVQYTDKPNGKITIGMEEYDQYFEFSISDNGKGIEEKYFDKIFQVFQSLNETKISSGIGLSIVKKLVKHYGGDIWLESEVGIGTTFYFKIKK